MDKFNYERLFIFENENEAIEKSLVLLLIEISFKEITLNYALQLNDFFSLNIYALLSQSKCVLCCGFCKAVIKRVNNYTVVFTHTYTYFNIIFKLIIYI